MSEEPRLSPQAARKQASREAKLAEIAEQVDNGELVIRQMTPAVLEALIALGDAHPVLVMSDSTYVVNCFRDRWWVGWLQRGWVNSKKQPVANRDLWEPLITLYRERDGEVAFRWVKGHGGDPLNDLVDRLAVQAALTQRSGASVPRRSF